MTSWAPTPPVQPYEHGSEDEVRLLRCEPAGMGKKTCSERRPHGHYRREHRAADNDRFPPPQPPHTSPGVEPRRPVHRRLTRRAANRRLTRSQLRFGALGFAFYRAGPSPPRRLREPNGTQRHRRGRCQRPGGQAVILARRPAGRAPTGLIRCPEHSPPTVSGRSRERKAAGRSQRSARATSAGDTSHRRVGAAVARQSRWYLLSWGSNGIVGSVQSQPSASH
jgi:hypothetical protein